MGTLMMQIHCQYRQTLKRRKTMSKAAHSLLNLYLSFFYCNSEGTPSNLAREVA